MIALKASPMQLMSLYMLKEDVPEAAVILAKSQSFDLTKANIPDNRLTELYEQEYAREFDQALERYRKIVSFLKIKLNERVKEISHVPFDSLQQTNEQLGDIWNQCISFEIRKRHLNEQRNMISYLKAIWRHMVVFDTDLSMLDNGMQFLDIRLGIMPSSYVRRLKKSLSLEGYYLTEHVHSGDSTHVVIAGLKEHKEKIQSLLEAASFQTTEIPMELQGQPEKVNKKIKSMESQYHAEYLHYKQNKQIFRDRYINQLLMAGDTLALARPFTLLSQEIRGIGSLVKVSGWVLNNKVSAITSHLQDKLGKKIIITTREPEPDEFNAIPSDIRHSRWIKPFISLIGHYGIPRYNEFDPSWFFTLSYILMFGIMFGDIGHGLSLMTMALILHRKWPDVAFFLLPIGLSSTMFGFIYGSLFCYEHVIPALWISPLSDPVLMLQVAFLWGVAFIVLLNIFSIFNHLSSHQYRKALLDGQGIAGLFLYFSMLWLGYLFIDEDFKSSYLSLMLIPLLLITFNKWSNSKESYGERFIIVVIESYELMINYLANTISFLRLAAFSLNHIALAITVFTLAEMMSGSSYWITIVLGNLFILFLEGAVVAIQTLRLEYYEGFSRFFNADGYKFEPLSISPRKLI